jgi:YYY domain-containing protein
MLDVLSWWLVLELVGIAVLPIAYRFFRNLADHGYAFIKPLGLLMMAYPYWLLTTFGFLSNTRGSVLGIAVLMAALSWGILASQWISELKGWLRRNLSYIVITELVFTLAFLAWALYRAYTPEITATEKPMEFAFLNGILQSDRFPPLDPWLAGYAISYYYFGYIIVAMITLMSNVTPGVAFNLGIALLFALSATGAFGLVYNTIRGSKFQTSQKGALFFAILAAVFLLVIGNLEAPFESLHNARIGSLDFYGRHGLDINGLEQAPVSGTFQPTDNWWWWRASRVVNDHDPKTDAHIEVIDEFPQFSFLLGDMHPHVLALPFALLALAAALNLVSAKSEIWNSDGERGRWFLGFKPWNSDWLLLPLILGGLFFLNTWDILPHAFVLSTAYGIARYRAEGKWTPRFTNDLVMFILRLGVLSVLLYFPFYLGFQSQAGGILPVLSAKTPLHQYLIMFGLFVFILVVFVARLVMEQRDTSLRNWVDRAAPFVAIFVGFPIVVAVIGLSLFSLFPAVREAASSFLGTGDNPLAAVIGAFFGPLVASPWLFILFVVTLTAIPTLLRSLIPSESTFDSSMVFILLLTFTGFLLTYGVEFLYLRDTFNTRMNTVFKFYFQAWTLFSIASGYACYYLSQKLKGIARNAWFIGLALLLGASLIYPALALPNRADGFQKTMTLDGIDWIRQFNPGDYQAIGWLRANAPRGATIVEAVGGEYSYGNRISMATGLPTPLGWFGHELQWRGNTKLFKDDSAGIDRAADIQRIYQSLDTQETLTLLDKYAIKFVVVGGTEKSQYGLTSSQVNKFSRILRLDFESGDIRIYER